MKNEKNIKRFMTDDFVDEIKQVTTEIILSNEKKIICCLEQMKTVQSEN
jgi:hypothetical protein